MNLSEIAKPLGVFVLVIAVVLAGTVAVSALTGSEEPPPADGQSIDGQSPSQYQPEAVNVEVDPETGEITVDESGESKQILIDSSHSNRYDEADLEPVVEALVEAGHTVDFRPSTGDSSGFGTASYNATLQEYDALLVIHPTESFSEEERAGLHAYTEGDGRVVVLGEPTQVSISGGFVSSVSTVSFGANDLTESYGFRVGAEGLYNLDDEHNDNNFKAINAEPTGSGMLTEGVETISFESAGYAVMKGDSDADVLFTAAEGSTTWESRRTGTYATVVRNDNVVFVSDSDFISESEVYDADNEVFVSNLLEFLVSGDKADDVPATPGDDDGFGGGDDDGGGFGDDDGEDSGSGSETATPTAAP